MPVSISQGFTKCDLHIALSDHKQQNRLKFNYPIAAEKCYAIHSHPYAFNPYMLFGMTIKFS